MRTPHYVLCVLGGCLVACVHVAPSRAPEATSTDTNTTSPSTPHTVATHAVTTNNVATNAIAIPPVATNASRTEIANANVAGTEPATSPVAATAQDARAQASRTQDPSPSAPRTRELALPGDWTTMSRAAFARALDEWTAGVDVLRLNDSTLTQLAAALAASDEIAVRAAVVLGRSRDPRGGEALLVRLEQRVPEGSRSLASDVVAAESFVGGAVARDAAARLETLARGATAHPVLDVRVSCAAASVALGRDGAIPFLLAVIREGTPNALVKPDWRRLDWGERRMQLLMDRAAKALSARAGIECVYRADAALSAREDEIVRLTRILSTAPSGK